VRACIVAVVLTIGIRAAAAESQPAAPEPPRDFLRLILSPRTPAAPAAGARSDVWLEELEPRAGPLPVRARRQVEAAEHAVALLPALAQYPALDPARRRLLDVVDLSGRVAAALQAHSVAPPRQKPERLEQLGRLSAALEVAREDYREQLARGAASLRDALGRPTALVVSGGTSLGSYEAGFLHYTSQHFVAIGRLWRALGLAGHGDDPGSFQVATGASAGSMNAFLAVLATCREPVSRPEESIFYRLWIPVGMAGLLGPGREQGALFSRAPLDAAARTLEELIESREGWSKDGTCRTLFGLSATPLRARTLELRPAGAVAGPVLRVHRHTEKFMFEISGERGRAPSLRPFAPPSRAEGDERLTDFYPTFSPVRADGTVAFSDVAQLLMASSSFPLAFRPVPLSYRLSGAEAAEGQRFIDGGVLDNTPLRLAMRMHRFHETAGGAEDVWVLFLEPNVVGWDKYPGAEKPRRKRRSNVAEYLDFAGDFVSAAREAELVDAMETEPHLRDRLLMPGPQLPLASAQLNNFLGFFEEDFRIFDFHMGMADAFDHLTRSSEAFRVLRAEGATPRVTSPIVDCLAAHRAELRKGRDPSPEALPACRALRASGDPSARNALALLHTSRDLKAWSRSPDYDEGRELSQFIALLGRHGYVYRDLRYRGRLATDQTALKAIRDELQNQVQVLGSLERNLAVRLGVATVGKALANELAYRVPRQFAFVGLQIDSGFEAGYARQLLDSRLRLVLTGKVYAFDRNLTQSAYEAGVNAATLAGSARAVAELPGTNFLQPEVGLGWGFYSRDGWGRHLWWRNGPEASLGVSAFQRLYLDIALTWFLDDCAGNNACSQVASRYRAEPVPLVLYRREIRGAIGWRFLID
jgi:predicted acylesterase/phospholipase RssA